MLKRKRKKCRKEGKFYVNGKKKSGKINYKKVTSSRSLSLNLVTAAGKQPATSSQV
jgi:hypothetical protein